MNFERIKAEAKQLTKQCDNWCQPGYWNPMSNPYKVNPRTGLDHFSNLAWQVTMWKMENVFPYDLRLRAPVVALLTIFSMKSKLISQQRHYKTAFWRSYILLVRVAFGSRDH